MIKRIILTVFFSLAGICAYAQMSDKEVISYIKQGLSNGKSQQELATELLAKGVTYDQLMMLKEKYSKGTIAESGIEQEGVDMGDSGEALTKVNRLRTPQNETVELRKLHLKELETKFDPEQDSLSKNVPLKEENGLMWRGRMMQVYGHGFFENKELSFEPNENMPTPANYVIGAGDEIIIDVWGLNEVTVNEIVSPDGRINIEQVGPVDVAGLTISQATARLKRALSQKYSLSGPNAESSMSVTLGQNRTIQVNVVGEVNVPGTYRLSSLSSVYNALYCAGGVNPVGSLRTIKIARGGSVVAVADLYKYLFEGADAGDIALKDGDAVIVPSYSSMVELGEGFKRPMLYEIIPGEPMEKVLNYAAGFASNAGTEEISVSRMNGTEGRMFTVDKVNFKTFPLQDGDVLNAHLNETDSYSNRVEVRGAVLRPGVFALGKEIATVRQLVSYAGGLLDDTFTGRAQLIREKSDRSLEVTAVALGAIMKGEVQDVLLRKNDILIVSNVNEMDRKGELSISGYVHNPGTYEYADGMMLEDLIMLAGGLTNGASTVRVDISRRIYDPESMESCDTIAQVFACRIDKGMMMDGASEFRLEPFDVIAVRRSPTYIEQKIVKVSGEVNFPGEYVLIRDNERLSDLFRRAGKSTANGYVSGAMLRRKVNEDEMNLQEHLYNTARQRRGASDAETLKKLEYYSVAINLEQALANPGGSCDVILRAGDELILPSMTNTVAIQGKVLYPNAVTYTQGLSVRKYIKQAGGFTNDAKKSKTFVVYMNGQASSGMNSKVVPGCEIFVPAKPERHHMTVAEWMGIGTTAASLATTIVTIANLIKK